MVRAKKKIGSGGFKDKLRKKWAQYNKQVT